MSERYETTVHDKRTGYPVSGCDGNALARAEDWEAEALRLQQEVRAVEKDRAVVEADRDRLREALRLIEQIEGWGDDAADEYWKEQIRRALSQPSDSGEKPSAAHHSLEICHPFDSPEGEWRNTESKGNPDRTVLPRRSPEGDK